MKEVALIFPHQLFKNSPVLKRDIPVFLVEEWLFFNQYKFHKHKLAFHRATMKFYESYLKDQGQQVHYIEAKDERNDVRTLIKALREQGAEKFHYCDVVDNWLEKHINSVTEESERSVYDSPLFINTNEDLKQFFRKDKKSFFQTSFYKKERQRLNLLMVQGDPEGGKWTYDSDNRKKYPKGKTPPTISFPEMNACYEEAKTYVETNYSGNYGDLETAIIRYPSTYDEAENWLQDFFKTRFHEFGPYEDAIVDHQSFLNHSVLSPLINIGFLEPLDVVQKAINYGYNNDVPLNSIEGFVRQIIGWREFIRGMYIAKGSEARTKNYWNAKRKIPKSWYTGKTGIVPIDITIRKINKTAYAHHIERLMVLGNFMVLCEFDPDDVYQWFMELFIDAYDWVMVPNVYSMSLYADGGFFATKPYISSSNYLSKMSNYKKGEWQQIWDGLFWRFMDKHRDFFLKNPRLGMLIRTFDKMSPEKKTMHLENAETFLKQLDE
ncbi:MAG: cryptochrome/photolyase family protein [bacterium]